jgi:hypothetical protein
LASLSSSVPIQQLRGIHGIRSDDGSYDELRAKMLISTPSPRTGEVIDEHD